MNDLNIPAIGKEKICSNCLRKLPTKYFRIDRSRTDGLACNCNSCLFPNGSYYKVKFPELYEPDRFPKVDPASIPALGSEAKKKAMIKARASRKGAYETSQDGTISTESGKTESSPLPLFDGDAA